ncbi:NAD(P)-binding protein [Xylaria sp. CBS 124048]|nr:NAD(P)-binding protein [Xylaria sp. CBS 124048]
MTTPTSGSLQAMDNGQILVLSDFSPMMIDKPVTTNQSEASALLISPTAIRGRVFSSGIGEACALAFAKYGVRHLVVADINIEAARAVSDACKSAATHEAFLTSGIFIDVTSESSVREAVKHVAQGSGRIDYFVNAAGVSFYSTCIYAVSLADRWPNFVKVGVRTAAEVAEASIDEFDKMLSVNVTGTFLLTRMVSAAMKSQDPVAIKPESPGRGLTRGCIVIIGSASAFTATPNMIQYTTSKHAVLGLTKSAALDNAAHGIRVNSVCPSWVDTPMVRKAIEDVPELAKTIENAVPMGRIALAEEVADAVMFLCSSMSSYATGCNLILDGGTTLSATT